MTTNLKTLTVRNLEQAACWLELDGQISDGFWENARPYDHYRVWCEAKVVVAAEGQPVGRDFYARKDNYNLSAKDLLDVVGKRMLGIVRIARVFGLETAALLEHDVNCEDGRINWSAAERYAETSDYWKRKAERMAALDQAGIDAALADETYGMKDLRKDLADLKTIIRTYNR